MSVSERIYKKREELGLSQTDLAKKAGLKPPAISQYESGSRSPSYEALIKLSHALNVTTDFLISGKEVDALSINDKTMNVLLKIIRNFSQDNNEKLLEYAVFLSNGLIKSDVPILTEMDYADYVIKNFSSSNLPIDVNEICSNLSISVFEDDLKDEGEGILIKGRRNVIILNNSIKNEQRKKFTKAILIGHAIIPWHVNSTYTVRKAGTSTLLTEDIQEMEAQSFAANLLIPNLHLDKDFIKTNVNLDNLKKLATEKYEVSLFAFANRLVDFAKDKYAVLQSDNWNVIKTFQGNRPLVNTINPDSLAATFFSNPSEVEEIRKGEVPANCWLIEANENEMVFEESIYNPEYKKVLTLITIDT